MSSPHTIHQVRENDRQFFERYPDREYRLRRAHDCEYVGEVDSNERVFVIVHRDDAGNETRYFYFKHHVSFRTALEDFEIAEFLQKAAA